MTFPRSWAFLLLAVLAATHCTESRSAHRTRRDRHADYNFDDNATGEGGEKMQGDEDSDGEWQGDDGDYGDAVDADSGDGGSFRSPSAPASPALISEDTRPVLISVSESVRARVGDDVRLSCHVANSSDEVVTWLYINNTLYVGWAQHMSKMSDTKTIIHSDYSLEIPSLEEKDSGNYTCQVALQLTQGTQRNLQNVTHFLKVYPGNRQPSITNLSLQPSDKGRITEGSRLVITCDAEGFPLPRLIWSKRDHHTKETARVTSADSVRLDRNALVIESVQRQHDGEYFCMAENNVGKPAIHSIDVNVVGKPAVHVHNALVNAAIGITAILGCSVHYEPRSVVSWQKDGVEIYDGADVVIEHSYPDSTLKIPVVKEKDFGTYTCVAQNQFGSHNRSVELVEQPVLETVRVAGDALLLTIHSHAPLRAVALQYRRSDMEGDDWVRQELKPIATSEKHVHVAKFPLTSLPGGKYEAVASASNHAGWSQPSSSVFFEGANDETNSAESIKAAGVGLTSGVSDLKSTLGVFASICLLVELF